MIKQSDLEVKETEKARKDLQERLDRAAVLRSAKLERVITVAKALETHKGCADTSI